jgi:hypothetical protein
VYIRIASFLFGGVTMHITDLVGILDPKRFQNHQQKLKADFSMSSQGNALTETTEMVYTKFPVGTAVRQIFSGNTGVVVEAPKGEWGSLIFVVSDADGKTYPMSSDQIEASGSTMAVVEPLPLGIDPISSDTISEPLVVDDGSDKLSVVSKDSLKGKLVSRESIVKASLNSKGLVKKVSFCSSAVPSKDEDIITDEKDENPIKASELRAMAQKSKNLSSLVAAIGYVPSKWASFVAYLRLKAEEDLENTEVKEGVVKDDLAGKTVTLEFSTEELADKFLGYSMSPDLDTFFNTSNEQVIDFSDSYGISLPKTEDGDVDTESKDFISVADTFERVKSRGVEKGYFEGLFSALKQVLESFTKNSYEYQDASDGGFNSGTAQGIDPTSISVNYDKTTFRASADLCHIIADVISGMGYFEVTSEDMKDPEAYIKDNFFSLKNYWEVYGERKPKVDIKEGSLSRKEVLEIIEEMGLKVEASKVARGTNLVIKGSSILKTSIISLMASGKSYKEIEYMRMVAGNSQESVAYEYLLSANAPDGSKPKDDPGAGKQWAWDETAKAWMSVNASLLEAAKVQYPKHVDSKTPYKYREVKFGKEFVPKEMKKKPKSSTGNSVKGGIKAKYSGDIYKDLESTDIDAIANSVSIKKISAEDTETELNQKELVEYLINKAVSVYKSNDAWGSKIYRREQSSEGARDEMYMWMEHWADGFIKRKN